RRRPGERPMTARTLALCCALALVSACRRDASPETAASAAAAQPAVSSATPGESRLHLDQAQLAEITLETVTPRAAGDVIRATGTVEFDADHTSRILTPVAGQVQQLRVNVGDEVRRGDTLFVLSSREVASAIADHLASQKDLDLAEKTFAMTRSEERRVGKECRSRRSRYHCKKSEWREEKAAW